MGGGFKKIDGPRLHLGPLALLPFMLTAAAVFLLQPADRPVFETGRRADVVDASERHRPSAASLALVGYSGDPPSPPYFSFFFFYACTICSRDNVLLYPALPSAILVNTHPVHSLRCTGSPITENRC